MSEPLGYWGKVFYRTTLIIKERPDISTDSAFWMARGQVDQESQVSGASPVAEVHGEQPSQPLPNASPTPGPGKVCGECKGRGWNHDLDRKEEGHFVRIPCPTCKGTGKAVEQKERP
jgi:hypothetical protein